MSYAYSTDDRYVAAYLMTLGFPLASSDPDGSFIRFNFHGAQADLDAAVKAYQTDPIVQGFIANFNTVNRKIRELKPLSRGSS